MSRLSKPFAAVLLVSLALSGCLQEPNVTKGPRSDSVPVELDFVPMNPIMFQGSANETGVQVVVAMRENCAFNPYPIWTYHLYDKVGIVRSEVVGVDATQPTNEYIVPLSGQPPFVLAGDAYACASGHHSVARGLVAADRLWNDTGYDLNLGVARDNVPLMLGVGETEATATWEAPPLAWSMDFGYPTIVSGRSWFRGTVTVTYPDGHVWRVDTYRDGHHAVGVHIVQ